MRVLSELAHEYAAMGVLGPIQLIGRRRDEYPLVQDTVNHHHPCCKHLLGETHMIQNLLEYSMCFTYIFWARQFCLVLHLYLIRARRWFYFVEIIDLSCLTYIILRVF